MAESGTLDSPQSSSSSSNPQLSRNLSSSRLNAQAPEFVPTRSTPQQPPQQQQQQQSHRMVIPPPPPPGMLHVYSTPPPPPPPSAGFHLPVHSPVPMPPHMVPVHHHMPMRNHHPPPPYQNRHHHHSRDQEVEAVAKKDHLKEQNKELKDHGPTSSKNGLSEEATLKVLNQVEYYFSDLNLATTDHLMRFINKDPEGYGRISMHLGEI